MSEKYYVKYGWNTPRPERDFAEEYECLYGPDGFRCCITEPEDRNFSRDLAPMVDKLNKQEAALAEKQAEIDRLKAENVVLRCCGNCEHETSPEMASVYNCLLKQQTERGKYICDKWKGRK
jgi:hypothetical protein